MRAVIRKVETQQIEVTGEELAEIRAELEARRPAGFDLISAPVRMQAGSTQRTVTGTYARRDETRVIEGANTAALKAATPEGWQILCCL